ncbi:dihydrodipicolinate synthase family protein [Achromobacter sp. NPDC058515]|uniref:dihydrodipicolinate synthase family protein n=1 Tax=Achromobacter sp. NPDC058515 TaxID=3346533 RepID=UPI0036642766
MSPILHGVIPAVPTPLNADGQPDTAKLVAFIRDLFDAGCQGVNLLGTTGEATSFDRGTRLQIMEAVANAGLAQRMMVGTGAAALADAVALTKAADTMGFAGALLLPPFYYTDVGDGALVQYVERLAELAGARTGRLYLYNIPQLTGLKYSPDVIERLTRNLGGVLAGIKDSSGDLPYAEAVAANFSQLAVFPSDEATLKDRARKKFAGCISASVNVFPHLACATYQSGVDTPDEIYNSMVGVRRALTRVPLVPAIKAALAWRREDESWKTMKLPLVPLSSAQLAQLHNGLAAAQANRHDSGEDRLAN